MNITYTNGEVLIPSKTRDLAHTNFVTSIRIVLKGFNGVTWIQRNIVGIPYEFPDFFGFVSVFEELYLEAQRELDNKLGY